MICLSAQYRSVCILEGYRVINIVCIVGCGISCITCAINDCLIPALEGVGIGMVSCFGRCFRSSYSITVVVCITAENCSIFILENYGIINEGRCISCDIFFISVASGRNLCVPTCEGINISIIWFLNRI